MGKCSEARPPAPRSDALRKIVTTKNIHSFDETIFLCALHSHPTALMQRKWIVLCSRGRPQLISYPRKWFDSCMHPRPERWCWLRRAAAGLRAGYTGTRAQTVPAALLLRVRVGSGGRESKLRLGLPAPSRVPLHWPEVPSAQDAGQAKTCAPSTPSLAQRRDPGQDVCAQHHVPGATRAKTCAPSTTSPEPRILSDRMHGAQVGRTPSFRRVPPSTQTPPTPHSMEMQ